MRIFDYKNLQENLMNHEIMNLVAGIREYKGKQDLFIESKADVLESMLEVAKIQSTGASNRIEGIYTSDERLDALMKERSEPRNRYEYEIAGYREVLSLIHENYDYMVPTSNLILQLHKELYQYNSSPIGGNFKNSDNIIAEIDLAGNKRIRFQPLSSFETPDAIKRLTEAYNEAILEGKYDPLILIGVFILDFLCIHPFNDGNGRISRLLTLLTLYRSGYIAGKYVSMEMVIEKSKESYYEALYDSSQGWHDMNNNYFPFVKYYLEIILNVYEEFSNRLELMQDKSLSKPERIKRLFDTNLGRLAKRDIMNKCPDISQSTVEQTLSKLLKENYIIKLGAGKNTSYIKNLE